MTRKLSHAKLSIIRTIADANQAGHLPNKADVCAAGTAYTKSTLPTRTRAGRYRMIDDLLRADLLDNQADNPQQYALAVSMHGWDALQEAKVSA